ncbi:MAG TPA: hypothetical protein VGP46_02350 [Acidimicrobiales bacterium]|jgi:hypothetical protein|nr:hypothetical protein [Acidimicrobiales bacterium]
MEMKQSFKKRLIGATCGATVVALAAGGVAMASTPASTSASKPASSSSNTSTVAKKGTLRQDLRWLATHTVHANLIVDTAHGYKTINIDRGTATTVEPNYIKITRPDGVSVTDTISSSTKFPGLPKSEVVKGDRVVLVAGTTHNGLVVWARPPATSTASAAS